MCGVSNLAKAIYVGVTVACFFLTFGRLASAQTAEQKSGARAIAEQGMDAYEAKDFSRSEDLFRRAEELVHATPHLLYLARSLERQGRLVEAREVFVSIEREQLAPSSPAAFSDAQAVAIKELEALNARLPYLTIVVEGVGAKEATVWINGEEINSVFLGVARPTDPGSLLVKVQAPGATPQESEIVLKEGAKEVVTIELKASQEASPAAGSAPAQGDAVVEPRENSGAPRYRIPAYAAMGVGVVGVVLGVVFLTQRSSSKSDAQGRYDDCLSSQACGPNDLEEIDRLDGKAATMGTLSIVSFGVGAAALGTGVVLYLVGSKGQPNEKVATKPYVGPWVGGNQVGIQGAF